MKYVNFTIIIKDLSLLDLRGLFLFLFLLLLLLGLKKIESENEDRLQSHGS